MGKRFFTADTHFGHARIQIYCPGRVSFSGNDIRKHDDVLIKNWNAKVGIGDDVYVIGDFAFADLARIKWLLTKLNGRIHLVIGNHDTEPWGDYIRAGFASVQKFVFINIKGVGPVGLAHDPAACICDRTIPWLNGHLHDQYIRFGNSINVGVDIRGYAPISEEELAEDFRITKIHMKPYHDAEKEILGKE